MKRLVICEICGEEKEYFCKNKCKPCYRAEKTKNWIANNREKHDAYHKMYRKKNPEVSRKAQSKYRKTEKSRIRNRRSDNNRHFGGNKEYIIEREKGLCAICRGVKRNVIHHIDGKGRCVPRAERNNNKNNLILLCQGCHSKIHMYNEKFREETEIKIFDYIKNLHYDKA